MSTPRLAVVAGAGSGIGQGVALRLAHEGWQLVLVGRDGAKLADTAAKIAATGGSAESFAGDLRDWARMGELAAHVEGLSNGRGLNLLVNSVGGQFAAPSAELSENGWRAVVSTNLDGAFFLVRHLHGALARAKGAVVMVVADIWRRPAPGLAHSAAARAGVVSLMRSLALEWAGEGVRVNAVSPGLTDTPALLTGYDALVERVPLGRKARVEEVVDAILYLAGASYVTGEVLTVDGGLNLV